MSSEHTVQSDRSYTSRCSLPFDFRRVSFVQTANVGNEFPCFVIGDHGLVGRHLPFAVADLCEQREIRPITGFPRVVNEARSHSSPTLHAVASIAIHLLIQRLAFSNGCGIASVRVLLWGISVLLRQHTRTYAEQQTQRERNDLR